MPALGVIAKSAVALLATQATLSPEAPSSTVDSNARDTAVLSAPWAQVTSGYPYGVGNTPNPSDWKGVAPEGWTSNYNDWKDASAPNHSSSWKTWKDGSGNWKNWKGWGDSKNWKNAPQAWKDKWANGTWSPNDWKSWNGKWNGTWPSGWFPGAGGVKYYPDNHQNKWFYFGNNGQKYWTGGKWDGGKWVPVEVGNH